MPDEDLLDKASTALEKAIDSEKRNKRFIESLGPAIVGLLQPFLEKLTGQLKDNNETLKKSLSESRIELKPNFTLPKQPQIVIPAIKVPEAKVTVKIPKIIVPEPKVTVKIPPIEVPQAQVNMPDHMEVSLRGISQKTPLPVILTDRLGNPYESIGSGGKGFRQVIADLGRINDTRIATDSGVTNAGTIRVVHVTDVAQSVVLASGGPSLEVKQVSGVVDSVNVLQLGGTAISTNTGTRDAGTQRVTIATDDSVPITTGTSLLVQQLSGATDSVNIVSSITLGIQQVSGAVDSVNVLQVGGNAINTGAGAVGTGTQRVVVGSDSTVMSVGTVASDTADDGSPPVSIGGIARQANPTAVAAGDRVSTTYDDLGRQTMRIHQVRDLIATAYVTLSTGTEATLLAAGAGTYLDLMSIMCANTSNAAVQVDVRCITAGNIVQSIEIPANGTAGWAPTTPWPQDETGNTWTVDMPDLTNSNVLVSALFSKEV